ncbi:MAG: cupin domain-containing protein [Nitrospirota bacterium]
MKTTYRKIKAYTTKDGSLIRELMHPTVHGNKRQSLAEAIIPAGKETVLHRHHLSEELYHITAGTGHMILGDEEFPVESGDTVLIPPKTPHKIRNTGNEPLKILCCCAPSYSHDDTELVE